jgi:hypothetical protein
VAIRDYYTYSRSYTHTSSNRVNSLRSVSRIPQRHSLHQETMLRSRIQFGTLKIRRSLQSARHRSTLEDLTQQSRVKPPGSSPKLGIEKFSRLLQWTLVPGELYSMLGLTRSDRTQGVFGYMALYGDFGEHEHIFSPVSLLIRLGAWDRSDICCGRT